MILRYKNQEWLRALHGIITAILVRYSQRFFVMTALGIHFVASGRKRNLVLLVALCLFIDSIRNCSVWNLKETYL